MHEQENPCKLRVKLGEKSQLENVLFMVVRSLGGVAVVGFGEDFY